MLHLAQKVAGVTVSGTDGEIGTLEDFYFEEAGWNVRYLLVDTGSWFDGKRVLLSPSVARRLGPHRRSRQSEPRRRPQQSRFG